MDGWMDGWMDEYIKSLAKQVLRQEYEGVTFRNDRQIDIIS